LNLKALAVNLYGAVRFVYHPGSGEFAMKAKAVLGVN
jgi:hypothetical protein